MQLQQIALKNAYVSPIAKPRANTLSRFVSSGKTIKLLNIGLAFVLALSFAMDASANERDKLKRIHDRLAGVPPTPAVLEDMVNATDLDAAADIAMQNPSFYNVTLKNFATPWTNEAQSVFEPLNDYSATVIGMIRDGVDFRQVLYGDIIYTGSDIAGYSHSNNTLYENLENSNADLSNPAVLVARTQSELPGGLPAEATAGVMTTRAASRAYYIDGTNRAMFRFTLLNHLCYDMEQLKDNTRTADRIRQDVSRSPGGDSRLFFSNCLACHAGMDPMAQAFAYYEWVYKDANPDTEDNPDIGRLGYTPGTVQPKYHINATTFKGGYITTDHHWSNYWRKGSNAWLGWETPPSDTRITVDANGVTHGTGAQTLGMELAHSDAFARCQVKKVFKAVCLRSPDNREDEAAKGGNGEFESIVTSFKTNYNMKDAFKRAAIYCSAE